MCNAGDRKVNRKPVHLLPIGMSITANGVSLLRKWEGMALTPYKDVGGRETVGFGHLMTRQERVDQAIFLPVSREWVPLRDFDEEAAERLLREDCHAFARAVYHFVKAPLNQNQRDALICFTFNVGTGALLRSSLLRRLNDGNFEAVPGEMMRWCRVDGEVVEGLKNRRKAEVALWRRPVEPQEAA